MAVRGGAGDHVAHAGAAGGGAKAISVEGQNNGAFPVVWRYHLGTEKSTIGVAIIEDDRRIRVGLATLINGTAGYRCGLSFRSMEDALARPWSEAPDVALVDLGLPGMSGIDGLKLLREKYPRMALLMLSVYEDDERIFEALCAGASGYLLKKTPPNKLLEYLAEVLRGGAPMSPEVARRVVRLFREIRPPERVE